MSVILHFERHASKPGLVQLVCEILKVYNCRISEILSARWNDFYPGKYLLVRGKKKSRDIDIRDREILRHLEKMHRMNPEFIFFPVKYYDVYSYIKKNLAHNFNDQFNKKNKKITHYYRYSNAEPLKKRKDATTVLHHNSKHSAKYYNDKLRES